MSTTDQARWSPSSAELSRALENDELEVYYQPIVDLRTHRLKGAEALIRWQHPKYGLLSPGRFLEQAEGAGLGRRFAERSHWKACRQMQDWSAANLDLPIVSLNISPSQAKPDCLGPHFRSILNETGLDPQRIAIEIHEATTAQTVSSELSSQGIQVWADDSFRDGPALRYLTHVPFSLLKLYHGFLWSTTTDSEWARTVHELIMVAHDLGLPVIATGVQHKVHVKMLREYGCDMIQGDYFCQPVPAETIAAMIASGGVVAPK